jgi:serine O-acetyltransferase
MDEFVSFLLTKVYNSKRIPKECIDAAFQKTCADINYHFPELDFDSIQNRIVGNSNELAVFLFRLGNELHNRNLETLKPQMHWLLKELCACEIYFNNQIDEGFYIIHGVGTVIGSRNTIGKGFKIHQGCTIGHKINGLGNGNTIGNNVTVYCNSSIIGELFIGDNVIVGAHVVISENVNSNTIITSAAPLKGRAIKS